MRVTEECEKAGFRWGQIISSSAPKSLQMVIVDMKLKDAPSKKSYGKPRWCIKKRRYQCAYKDPYSQSHIFSSSHVRVLDLDHKKG